MKPGEKAAASSPHTGPARAETKKEDEERRAPKRRARGEEEESSHAWAEELVAEAKGKGVSLLEHCKAIKRAPAQHSLEVGGRSRGGGAGRRWMRTCVYTCDMWACIYIGVVAGAAVGWGGDDAVEALARPRRQ